MIRKRFSSISTQIEVKRDFFLLMMLGFSKSNSVFFRAAPQR